MTEEKGGTSAFAADVTNSETGSSRSATCSASEARSHRAADRVTEIERTVKTSIPNPYMLAFPASFSTMDSRSSVTKLELKRLLMMGNVKDAFLLTLPDGDVFSESVFEDAIENFVRCFVIFYPRLDLPTLKSVPIAVSGDAVVDLFSCRACGKIVEDPLTLPCPEVSHTVCRGCAAAGSCPVCEHRVPATSLSDRKTTFAIQRLLEALFPEQMAIYGMRKDGNRLLKAGDFAGAVDKYSAALEKDGKDAVLFSNRSHAFLLLKEPTRALADAAQAVSLEPLWAKAYFRKAGALFETGDIVGSLNSVVRVLLIDRDVQAARDLLVKLLFKFLHSSGGGAGAPAVEAVRLSEVTVALDRFGELVEQCRRSLQDLGAIERSVVTKLVVRVDISSEKVEELLTCTLCYRILYQAVTPDCGHSFCKTCLHRVLDFKPRCPECRQDLSSFLATRIFGWSEMIDKCSMLFLPQRYEERIREHAAEIRSLTALSDDEVEVAIFVLTTVWPGIPFFLNVFEPRYRLMIRQATESGSNLFGMCEYTENRLTGGAPFAGVGTMLKITQEVEYSEDGRCFVQTIGQRRFTVLSRGMRDGYHTAKVKFIKDSPIAAERLSAAIALQDEIYSKVHAWVHLRQHDMRTFFEHYGPFPDKADLTVYTVDGPTWIWWTAAVASTLGVQTADTLAETNVETRIRYFDDFVTSEIILHRINALHDFA
ncbi:LON peptidase N-terminal domain and RING finger protein 3 [Hypsibius exemplaris]|uniref:LON peptidase N-terminal domain and RING finger protein 3 n=1 Tax=Hypsibius exemplaris TaxID=2072580 RepID=A0A1W0WZ87_HYPEX|nr:LON peptidase N-terminal domain and RING finger protein 3 [Hypsibius exemplaris]